jgi:FMN phosphatase YigB (HAD superfamily)
MKLISFDIFDTVLIRKCGLPENIFPIVAEKLFPNDLALQQEFVQSRIYRTVVLSRTNPNYTLYDIYNTDIVESFQPYTQQQLIDCELSIEEEMLTRNNTIVETLEKYRQKDYTIAFISDMYICQEFIKKILVREHIFQDGDQLFVSNAVKKRKDDGSLYDYVQELNKPTLWKHYGDNKQSDYKNARKKGIEAHLINSGFTSLEKDLQEASPRFRSYKSLSLLMGLLRSVRLQECDTADARLVVDFLSSAYIPYVNYLLQDAHRRGFTHLYFLSRDSYILEEIAKHISHEGIEFHYLFVSRASLILPFLWEATRKQLRLLLVNDLINVDRMLNRLHLSRQVLEKNGLTISFNDADTEKRKETLLDVLFDSKIYPIWQSYAAKEYETCCGYFRQEGLFNDSSIALVDVGWTGTSRLMINSIRNKQGVFTSEIFSYYWYLTDNALPGKYGHYSAFMKREKLKTEIVTLFERYYSLCPYTSTIRYEFDGTNYLPVLDGQVGPMTKKKTLYHVKLACQLTDIIAKFSFDNDILYYWCHEAYEQLRTKKHRIDLSPLIGLTEDNRPLIVKMKLKDYIRYIRKPKSYYAMPRYCFRYNIWYYIEKIEHWRHWRPSLSFRGLYKRFLSKNRN